MLDHRKLGRELEIYHLDPLVGAGLPIWLPAGAAMRHAIESYIREVERLAGYQHVYSPPLAKREMYQKSGHLAKFGDDMFPPLALGEEELMLRPSLCPHHAMVFQARGRSYRELPLRVAELGGMYRAERSGVVGGLSRVRAIQLNDAHLFCMPEQVGQEVAVILSMILKAHKVLGFAADSFRLSCRGDLAQGNYLGEPAQWDQAEGLLREALAASGVSYVEAPGEAAFYGPKIDIQIRDIHGREFSLSTIQVDFAQPERFDLNYVASDGSRARPVMVHRSLIGSLERLVGHLIEVHQGAFPAWYAPVQLAVLPVSAEQAEAAYRLADSALQLGLRVEVYPDESLGARIRKVSKVPYVAVIGAREADSGEVALRERGGGQRSLSVAEALDQVGEHCRLPL
ncbi:MAG TPA: threonine--tRNA ligase [Micromonosporaceae bacterium]|nr:threonine--tRNA ligase [Micromonosporaceae bacterium]HCU51836.1 threonine--tRNA ligase [Micromonosporaceae bacterium]